jgi:hypothetical protein
MATSGCLLRAGLLSVFIFDVQREQEIITLMGKRTHAKMSIVCLSGFY